MSKFLLVFVSFLLLTLPGILVAQFTDENTWKDKGYKSPQQDFLMVEYTHERLTNTPAGFRHGFFTRGVVVQGMYDLVLKKSNYSVAAGLAFSSQSIFNNSRLLRDDSLGASFFQSLPQNQNYQTNKMVTNFIEIPLELRYRTDANDKGHSWKYTLGVRVGRLLDVYSKYKDGTGKYKDYIFPDVNNTRIGAYARVGYGKVSLSFYRSFAPYLQNSLQGNMNNYSIGLQISLF